MITGTFNTLDEMFLFSAQSIFGEHYRSRPRKGSTLGQHPYILELSNPRARCITYARENWSLALAFAEFCWHWRGEDSVEPLTFYASSWAKAADGAGKVRGSAYGKKIFTSSDRAVSQWFATKNLLKKHPSSRRAILFLSDDSNDQIEQVDFPCAVSLQFILREKRLDAITFMRSSDLYYGFCYDVFFFSLLQELMAKEVGAELGSYFHMGSSIHIYEKDIGKINFNRRAYENSTMPPVDNIKVISEFAEAERNYRETLQSSKKSFGSSFWDTAFEVLRLEIDRKFAAQNHSRTNKAI